jgi:hypothetical protein
MTGETTHDVNIRKRKKEDTLLYREKNNAIHAFFSNVSAYAFLAAASC